jgi:hypothetical protein
VNSAVLHKEPWSGALDVPLNQNQVFSLAASFITKCPDSNPTLPFKAFPTLTVNADGSSYAAGSTVQLAYDEQDQSVKYLALFTGLDTLFAQIDENKRVALPEGLQGTVYAIVSTNGTVVSDDSTVAGPAILAFHFPSSASNP